jgi:hypothetical protein
MLIEKVINDYLNNLEDALAPSYTEMPKTFPGKCYLIEKTGDSRTDHINRATVAIQSYGGSLYEAMLLNEALKDIMINDLIQLDDIAGVKLNSDYNYTDTTTKRYRYQAVFSITYY